VRPDLQFNFPRGATHRATRLVLRTVTVCVVLQDWDHLLCSVAAAAIRPPLASG
jgi:hypothetical protein